MDIKPIERPNTLAGLIEKRREIAGKIEHHQRVLNELIIDLDHLDHTIRLFDPDCDVTLAAKAVPGPPRRLQGRDAAFRAGLSEPPQSPLRRSTSQ